MNGFMIQSQYLRGFAGRAERQARGTQQTGVVAAFARHDLHLCGRQRKRSFGHLLIHVFLKQFPAIHNATAYHNHFGIQNIDEIRQPDAQINPHAPEDLKGQRVTRDPRAINLF